MNVLRIEVDVNEYQSVYLSDADAWSLDQMTFDCSPRLDGWDAPEVYVLHPKKKRGDFFGFGEGIGTIVITESTRDKLADLLEMSAECLPLRCGNETLYVVNVIECVNALDESRSKRDVYPDGSPARILEFAFHSRRFTETPLFKIPETCKIHILTIEGMKDQDDEFKGRVESLGLQGLEFDLLWSGANLRAN
jgi:hypothetical protein